MEKIVKVQALAATLCLGLGTISVQAQPAGPPPNKGPGAMADPIKAADKNGDQLISREEAKAFLPHVAENFDKIDANGDGQLSRVEMRQWSEQRRAARQAERKAEMERRFKAADKDGDGHISRAEAEASMPKVAKRFDVLDANKDGKLTREELASGARHTKGPGKPHS